MNPEIFDYLEGDSTVFEQGPMQKLAAEGQDEVLLSRRLLAVHGYPERDEKIRRTVAVRKSTMEDLERLRSCYDIKRTEIIL